MYDDVSPFSLLRGVLEKKKIGSAEDFIGWRSDDDLLEVIDIYGKQKYTKIFKVICHKCKEDNELFPLGYFVSQKINLVKGQKPCGCAKIPKWNKDQFLVLARRASQGKFIVHGLAEEFHGKNTKLNLECIIDRHKWVASITSVINGGRGCPKCAIKINSDNKRTDEQEALDKCKSVCEIEGYESLGFQDSYKNAKTRFEYKCPKHGIQNVSYDNFISNGTRCKGCWKDRHKEIIRESGNGNGYYPERKDEKDFLYVLNFNDKFIKVGRSFDVERRIGKNELQRYSGITNIIKLRIFTATHQEIYDTEQEILKELRERGFQYYMDWTNECFENECLFVLDGLLDMCDNITEIKE